MSLSREHVKVRGGGSGGCAYCVVGLCAFTGDTHLLCL